MNDPFDDLLDAVFTEGAGLGSEAGSRSAVRSAAAFTESVMAAVRTEVLPPLPFPWRRIGLGAALAAGAALLAATLPAESWTATPSGDPGVWLAPLAVVVLLAPRILAAVAGEGS